MCERLYRTQRDCRLPLPSKLAPGAMSCLSLTSVEAYFDYAGNNPGPQVITIA